ncbi:zinc finger protein 638-like isoform X2 [Nerophis ophidion]|uniref:zinc finger protein 638-like isoform X2 n=1 Tax=Nerophis ophidion TaxID=159077 RepID=UPI002AE01ABA|nr:zinc finger protein 638-like isoform X2 [Nerophis ophidion]
MFPTQVPHGWPEPSTVPSNEAILRSINMHVRHIKEVRAHGKPLPQPSHQSCQQTDVPPFDARTTALNPLDQTTAAESYGGAMDSCFNVFHETKLHHQSIPGLCDHDHPMSDKLAAPPGSSPTKYTSESAANILQRFGLEKEDMDLLLAYPEDQITPASLPFILRQIRLQKAERAVAATTTIAATAIAATVTSVTASATTDLSKVLTQFAQKNSLKHSLAAPESNTLENALQAAYFRDQANSSSSLSSMLPFVAPKSHNSVYAVQSFTLTGKEIDVQHASSKIVYRRELEAGHSSKPESQASIAAYHQAHSSRPNLLLISCKNEDDSSASEPRRNQYTKELQQRMAKNLEPTTQQCLAIKQQDISNKQDMSNKPHAQQCTTSKQDMPEKPDDGCSKRVQPICSIVTQFSCLGQPPTAAPPRRAPLSNALPQTARISNNVVDPSRVFSNMDGLVQPNSSLHLTSRKTKPVSTFDKARRRSPSPCTSRRRSYSSSSCDSRHSRSRSYERSPSRSKKRRWSPERRRNSPHSSRHIRSYRSRSRSWDRQYPSARSHRGTSSPPRSPKKCLSPERHRDRSASPKRFMKRHSLPRRSQDAKVPFLENSYTAEHLAKKVLETSAVQSLSNQRDLETVVKTLAPALLAELLKMESFSSLALSSPSSADKQMDVTEAPTSSFIKVGLKSSPPTMVKLEGICSDLSHDDVASYAENFGKTKSVVLFRAKGEAIVCFEQEDAAKKMKNVKSFCLKDIPVSVVKQMDSDDEESNTYSTSSKPPLHEMPAVSQQTRAETSTELDRQPTPSRTYPISLAKVSKATASYSKAKNVSIKQVSKGKKRADKKGPAKARTLTITVKQSQDAVKEKGEQSKCCTDEQCNVEVSSELAIVGPASVTEPPLHTVAQTEDVSDPLPAEFKSFMGKDKQKTNVEDDQEVTAESCQTNKDDYDIDIVKTSVCKEGTMVSEKEEAQQVIDSVEEHPTSTESETASEWELCSPCTISKKEEHDSPKTQQTQVKNHTTSGLPEVEQKHQVVDSLKVQQSRSMQEKTHDSSVEDEETTFHILDYVDTEIVQEEPSITTQSSRGKRGRLLKNNALSEKRVQEEMTPMKKRTRTSQECTKKETPTKKTQPVLKDEVKSPPTTRGKGRRGRPKKAVQTTKSKDDCLEKDEQDAGDEEETPFQVLDSVENKTLHDHNSPKKKDMTDSKHQENKSNEIIDSLNESPAKEVPFDGDCHDDDGDKDESVETSQPTKCTRQRQARQHLLTSSSEDNASMVLQDKAEEADPEEASSPNWSGRAMRRGRPTSVVKEEHIATKRTRSQAPCVAPSFGLPAFKANNPLGQEFVRCGYFCDVCSTFYQHEITTQEVHCSSREHYNNLKKYYGTLQQKASKR